MKTIRDEFVEMMRASYPDGCCEEQWQACQDAFYAGCAVLMIRSGEAAVSQTRVNGVKEIELLWSEVEQYVKQRKTA